MPEALEVETYRRKLTLTGLDRVIEAVEALDPWYLKRELTADGVADALVGHSFRRIRRRGKLLLVDLSESGSTIGLHFGMTGRLLIDGVAAIERLEYSSSRDEPAWDRFVVRFADGGELRIRDPRRLGGVELNPDEGRLGPDVLSVTLHDLRRALGSTPVPVKARLLDQSRIAGLGNLLTDEVLFRAGIDPAKPVSELSESAIRHLHRHLRETLRILARRGGSHCGDLQASRVRGGHCPKDGAILDRRVVAGRTTYSCRVHQR